MGANLELLDHLEHHHLIERSWLDSNCTDPEGFHLRCHARGEAMGETGLDCNRDHASDDLTPRGELSDDGSPRRPSFSLVISMTDFGSTDAPLDRQALGEWLFEQLVTGETTPPPPLDSYSVDGVEVSS